MVRIALTILAAMLISGCAAPFLQRPQAADDCPSCQPALSDEIAKSAFAHTAEPDSGDTYYGAGGHLIPSIGASIHGGRVIRRTKDWTLALEAELMGHFIDDEAFVDDGNPAADPFIQLKTGVKFRSNPSGFRHWTARAGLTYFYAGKDPNIVQDEGSYLGVYGGIGYETDITQNITVGPELSLTVASKADEIDFSHGVVPTLSWRVTWWPGGNGCSLDRWRKPGELYMDLAAMALPSIGGGFGFGQVFSREDGKTWSFEALAGLQSLDDGTLWADSDGEFGQFRGGVKVAFADRGMGHWVGRAGLAFLRNTGEIQGFSDTGDYFGGYVGIGYEFEINKWLTMGPEISLTVADKEGLSDIDIEVLPQFLWHVIIKF